MRVSTYALIPASLLAACTDEPVAPDVEDAGLIQAAKGTRIQTEPERESVA